MPLPLREIDLERQCSDILALDGWRVFKTDPVSDRARGKGFGEKGMCDRLYLRYHNEPRFKGSNGPPIAGPWATGHDIIWIEWKRIRPGRKKAEKSKPHQVIWQGAERERGAFIRVAGEDFPATFEGFCCWYRRSGLLRRPGLV